MHSKRHRKKALNTAICWDQSGCQWWAEILFWFQKTYYYWMSGVGSNIFTRKRDPHIQSILWMFVSSLLRCVHWIWKKENEGHWNKFQHDKEVIWSAHIKFFSVQKYSKLDFIFLKFFKCNKQPRKVWSSDWFSES